jgi:hypothetical protein
MFVCLALMTARWRKQLQRCRILCVQCHRVLLSGPNQCTILLPGRGRSETLPLMARLKEALPVVFKAA